MSCLYTRLPCRGDCPPPPPSLKYHLAGLQPAGWKQGRLAEETFSLPCTLGSQRGLAQRPRQAAAAALLTQPVLLPLCLCCLYPEQEADSLPLACVVPKVGSFTLLQVICARYHLQEALPHS